MLGIAGVKGTEDSIVAWNMLRALNHGESQKIGVHSESDLHIGGERSSILKAVCGSPCGRNASHAMSVAFTGEIYNLRALRNELSGKGHILSTESEAEVILHLYREHAERCVDRLRGMFAIAIADGKRLFLTRDRSPALRIEDFALAPPILPDIQQWARSWRTRLSDSIKVLAVHAETRPKKMWPVQRFVETLDEFLGRHHDVLVLALSKSDQGLDHGKYGERVVRCYNFPLPCVLALMGQVDSFLGVDSCMLHAADLFRIPGVGLFGPTKPSDYGFRFAPHRDVRGFDQTMDAITVSEVLNALESVFQSTSNREVRPS